MTIDTGLASVIVAAITAMGVLANTAIAARQGSKIRETHKQVTVNHHSSKEPTVLDRIDDVRTAVLDLTTDFNGLHKNFNAHVAHSNQMDLRLIAVEEELEG